MLNHSVSQTIQNRMGPMEIDLFPSRLTTQADKIFPQTLAPDAMLQDWAGLNTFANPPWGLIGRVLAKIRQEQPQTTLYIAPVWPAQVLYPVLLDLLVDYPRQIPQQEDLVIEMVEGTLPDIEPQVVVWPSQTQILFT